MPKTTTITTYQYDELATDAAKERARDWYRQASAGDNYFAESVLDDAQAVLRFCGFTIENIYFSGFSSQGDGACFVGSWRASEVAADKLREHAPMTLRPEAAELIRIADALADIAASFKSMSAGIAHRRFNRSHEHSVSISVDFGRDDPIEDMEYDGAEYTARKVLLDSAEENFTELARDAMRWIYDRLRAEYEYQDADEQVTDAIRANEYYFCANGDREHHCGGAP